MDGGLARGGGCTIPGALHPADALAVGEPVRPAEVIEPLLDGVVADGVRGAQGPGWDGRAGALDAQALGEMAGAVAGDGGAVAFADAGVDGIVGHGISIVPEAATTK